MIATMSCIAVQGLLVAVLSTSSVAQDAVSEEPMSDEQLLAAEQRAEELTRQLIQRRQALEELQFEVGIYDQSLIEANTDLANLLLELEDYQGAAEAYEAAFQLERINTGLFSAAQVPLIDALIQAYGKQDDWQEVDDLQELRLHIQDRLYQPGDIRYLQAAQTYGQWKLRTLRENLLQQTTRTRMSNAMDLSEFYERIIEQTGSTEIDNRQLLSLLFDKSQADISLARTIAITPYTAFAGTASRYLTETRCQNVRTANGQLVRQCYNVQVENPRYRQSQQTAKQVELNRHTRAVAATIERLRGIQQTTDLSPVEAERLERDIAQLETESQDILRAARRGRLF